MGAPRDYDPPPEAPPGVVRDEQAALDELARVGGEQLARDLAALYLEQMPERLLAARVAIRDGDAAGLAAAAHAMKSSSAQLGAAALAEACGVTEVAAEGGDLRAAREQLDLIESRYATFSAWLAERTGPGPRADRKPAAVAGRVIAVVEDNADNRLLVDAILGDRFVLDEYATGVDALAGMLIRRPALVLLDVSLPGMDGIEVLARIRGEPALGAVPVVALTAHAMAGDRERYLTFGFDGYVAKPIVDEDILLGVIHGLLSREGDVARGNTREPSSQS